jgi:uncharacterized protein YdaU (DUF1376 family)
MGKEFKFHLVSWTKCEFFILYFLTSNQANLIKKRKTSSSRQGVYKRNTKKEKSEQKKTTKKEKEKKNKPLAETQRNGTTTNRPQKNPFPKSAEEPWASSISNGGLRFQNLLVFN